MTNTGGSVRLRGALLARFFEQEFPSEPLARRKMRGRVRGPLSAAKFRSPALCSRAILARVQHPVLHFWGIHARETVGGRCSCSGLWAPVFQVSDG